jgi:hypothetical protein
LCADAVKSVLHQLCELVSSRHRERPNRCAIVNFGVITAEKWIAEYFERIVCVIGGWGATNWSNLCQCFSGKYKVHLPAPKPSPPFCIPFLSLLSINARRLRLFQANPPV